jgi:3-oxoacyl-[acyl-carrier protein] reductase
MSGSEPLKRVVVVTGSSSGIGQAIAREFLSLGDYCVLHGNRQFDSLNDLAREYTSGQSVAFKADFHNTAAVEKFVDEAFAWQGYVDVWIHAAGADVLTVNADADFETKLEELWQVDVRGTILACRQVALKMSEQPKRDYTPSILTIGWDQSSTGMEGDSGQMFSAIKSAVENFTKSLSKTVGPAIRVNCIAPGWIQTAWGEQASPHWDRRARGESCLGRWGTPQDVAQAAVFLASPQASFINGQIIAVNGGWKPAWP